MDAKQPGTFTVGLRVPDYVRRYTFKIDGVTAEPVMEKGYAYFTRRWDGVSVIEIDFDIPARFMAAHPEVRADAGKVALTKGPIVYCLEEIDNGSNLASIIVDPREPIAEDYDLALFGGTPVLRCAGRRIMANDWDTALYRPVQFETESLTLKAVPYCLWGNREPGEMIVWLRASI